MTMSVKGAALVTALLLGGMGGVVATATAQEAGTLEPMRIVGQADHRTIPLESGAASHSAFGGYRYVFTNDATRNIRVSSEQWSPEGTPAKLFATLKDSQGRIVARSRSASPDFVLEQRIPPGSYVLEVRGSRLHGGWNRGTHQYRLVTDMGGPQREFSMNRVSVR